MKSFVGIIGLLLLSVCNGKLRKLDETLTLNNLDKSIPSISKKYLALTTSIVLFYCVNH